MCLCDHTKGTQFELFLFQLFKVVSAFYKNEKSIFKSLRSLKKSYHTKDTCNCIHSCDKKTSLLILLSPQEKSDGIKF